MGMTADCRVYRLPPPVSEGLEAYTVSNQCLRLARDVYSGDGHSAAFSLGA